MTDASFFGICVQISFSKSRFLEFCEVGFFLVVSLLLLILLFLPPEACKTWPAKISVLRNWDTHTHTYYLSRVHASALYQRW